MGLRKKRDRGRVVGELEVGEWWPRTNADERDQKNR